MAADRNGKRSGKGDQPYLHQFVLKNVVDKQKTIGEGSYAAVKELSYCGLKCVGKKMHALLFNLASEAERSKMKSSFQEECELLSQLHHPCIVQFLGIYLDEESPMPILVMEYLYNTLANCLDQYGILPEEIGYPILRDVALGLRYLHEHLPPIIHRDLSANNVLLTADMNAKISDLGVAKMLNLSPAKITQKISTQAPGTPCYMPPEALISNPSYTSKIDNYSYGVMMIHVLCGKWPFPTDAFRHNPQGSLTPITEVDRRATYLQKIGYDHPLMDLIKQCLDNSPRSRPEASEILVQLEEMTLRFPPPFENKIEMVLKNKPSNAAEKTGSHKTPHRADKESESPNEVEEQRKEYDAQRESFGVEKEEVKMQREELESDKRKLEAEKEAMKAQREEMELQRRWIERQKSEMESQRRGKTDPHRETDAVTWESGVASEQSRGRKEEMGDLKSQFRKLSVPFPSPTYSEPYFVHAQTRLHWRKCADLPIGMGRPHSVMVQGKVYVGGGVTDDNADLRLVFEYDPGRDEWSTLPQHPLVWFALGQFGGKLITVGGVMESLTGKVICYREDARIWDEYIQPLPSARCLLSVVTTESAIIACGGTDSSYEYSTSVEIYLSATRQWHEADPLPIPCAIQKAVKIGDTCYLLGGNDATKNPTRAVLCAPIPSLIQKATTRYQRSRSVRVQPEKLTSLHARFTSHPNFNSESVWKMLRDTPTKRSAGATLGGCLLSIGGFDNHDKATEAVYLYQPPTNSWVRMTAGSLPTTVRSASAVQLANNKLLVCGGRDSKKRAVRTVYVCLYQ